jgi:hypothetical protein
LTSFCFHGRCSRNPPNAATEAHNTDELDTDSGTNVVVLDESNIDQKGGHFATKLDDLNVRDNDIHGESQLSSGPIKTIPAPSETSPFSSDDEYHSAELTSVNWNDLCYQELHPISSPTADASSAVESCGVLEHPFADHPACIELRQVSMVIGYACIFALENGRK